ETTTSDVGHHHEAIGGGIDKSVLALGEPRRYRDRAHLKFVSTQACLVCGRQPSDPHHLSFTQPRAFGRKVSDEFAVPLCRGHHREVHRTGDEAAWWNKFGLDPLSVATALWSKRALSLRLRCPEIMGSWPIRRRTAQSQDPFPSCPKTVEIAKRSELTRLVLNDFFQANRGQPPQRAQKHRSHHRSRQTAIPVQRRTA